MFNDIDYAEIWSRIGWWLLIPGLLVLGLSMWLGWPTVIALIAMTVSSFGILVKLISNASVRPEEGRPWYLVIPSLVFFTMLFGIAPVLLTLAYVFGSTALLWAAGIAAGIGLMVFLIVGSILSRIKDVMSITEMVTGRRARPRPTESGEEDDVPRS